MVKRNCFLGTGTAAIQGITLTVTDWKLYVPVVTLSTPDNMKLLKQLKSQILKEQLIGTNINLKYQRRHKIDINIF